MGKSGDLRGLEAGEGESGGEERDRRCEAVIRGPIVLVRRWCVNESNDLNTHQHTIRHHAKDKSSTLP